MKHSSMEKQIILFLYHSGGYVFGGIIEDQLRLKTGHKASTISRVCRSLADKGVLDNQYVRVHGVGPRVVQYKLSDLGNGMIANIAKENQWE